MYKDEGVYRQIEWLKKNSACSKRISFMSIANEYCLFFFIYVLQFIERSHGLYAMSCNWVLS